MSASDPAVCRRDGRRGRLGPAGLNGIESISIGSPDGTVLVVNFLAPLQRDLDEGYFRIEGGRRITGLRVTAVKPCAAEDGEPDSCRLLVLNRAGDFSTYNLSLVQPGRGRPGDRVLGVKEGFDSRYASMDFTFTENCPSDLDCATAPEPPALELA